MAAIGVCQSEKSDSCFVGTSFLGACAPSHTFRSRRSDVTGLRNRGRQSDDIKSAMSWEDVPEIDPRQGRHDIEGNEHTLNAIVDRICGKIKKPRFLD